MKSKKPKLFTIPLIYKKNYKKNQQKFWVKDLLLILAKSVIVFCQSASHFPQKTLEQSKFRKRITKNTLNT